jgi:hypothetical protein
MTIIPLFYIAHWDQNLFHQGLKAFINILKDMLYYK